MSGLHSRARLALLAAVAFAPWVGAEAAPITITTPYLQLDSRANNSLGIGVGDRLRFGANAVVPNGNALPATSATATTINQRTGVVVSRTVPFSPDTVRPNAFDRSIADDPNLRGPWTLTFDNGPDSRSVTVSLPAAAQHVGFVNNVAVSGSSLNPTFTWTPPSVGVVNGYRVNIYDKDRLTQNGSVDNVFSRNFTTPSFTIPTLLAGGLSLDPTHRYSLEINALSTRDGSAIDLDNGNVYARSRSYFDFRPISNGAPVVNLPVLLGNGAYQFNIAVLGNQIVYIDPEVAIGYDYAIGAGDPNFRSVLLPADIGDGLYDLYGLDANGVATLLLSDLAGGTEFDFGVAGVSRFRVLGIETSAGLDPADVSAFITALRFTRDGVFTGTMTPISVEVADAVSAPGTLALLMTALGGLIRRRLADVARSGFRLRTCGT